MSRALVLLACVMLASTSAYAQYFGQNKVQYEKFDFKVLKTEHFDIYYYPEEEAAVRLAARIRTSGRRTRSAVTWARAPAASPSRSSDES